MLTKWMEECTMQRAKGFVILNVSSLLLLVQLLQPPPWSPKGRTTCRSPSPPRSNIEITVWLSWDQSFFDLVGTVWMWMVYLGVSLSSCLIMKWIKSICEFYLRCRYLCMSGSNVKEKYCLFSNFSVIYEVKDNLIAWWHLSCRSISKHHMFILLKSTV